MSPITKLALGTHNSLQCASSVPCLMQAWYHD